MKKLYIITGANGHLGNTIIRTLKPAHCLIRGLITYDQNFSNEDNITYFRGDITDKKSLLPLFENTTTYEVIVIHTAGIISISDEITEKMYEVNVIGTENLLDLSLKNHVSKFVYVSSVHAIPEGDKLHVLTEISYFCPDFVEGGYAKTKATATSLVLDFVKKGLPAVIVQPSGILGPYDTSHNHLVQLVDDYCNGKLPASVQGGYDFVDVRDVAQGCIATAEKGKVGECYILSNRHYEIKEILKMVKRIKGGKSIPTLPISIAKLAIPLMTWIANLLGKRPLYTSYSLYTLTSDDKFSHDKATRELDYHPRDLYETVKDTIEWQNSQKN